jgi:hypothetical protein
LLGNRVFVSPSAQVFPIQPEQPYGGFKNDGCACFQLRTDYHQFIGATVINCKERKRNICEFNAVHLHILKRSHLIAPDHYFQSDLQTAIGEEEAET